MSDQWTLSDLISALIPEVREAYELTAPKQPGEQCVIGIPIPGPIFDFGRRTGEVAMALGAAEPYVFHVRYMPSLGKYFEKESSAIPAVPGIVVSCLSWNEWQQRRAGSVA